MARSLAGVYGRVETDIRPKMLFSSRRSRRRAAAERLYASCLEKSRDPALFTRFAVPDTVQGRFEMLTLHLFPVLQRLMRAPGDDPELARLVSEALVNDMDAAMREMGVGDVSVPKRMKTLYRSFAGRVAAYTSAAEAGEAPMAAALARNVYPDEDAADRMVAARALDLARYVQTAIALVRAADLDTIRRGEPPFPSVGHTEAAQ
jgi:cytochrome b pre-mRNA-processing protein 3